jgi:hypothetical protein
MALATFARMAREHIADQGDSQEEIPLVASKEVTSLESARSRWSIFGWLRRSYAEARWSIGSTATPDPGSA